MALTSVTDVKLHLGITGSGEDSFLAQLLAGVEAGVLRWTKRGTLESAAATEYYSGNGRELLCLRRRPVTAIASIYVDGAGYFGNGLEAFPAASLWNLGEHYTPLRLDQSEQNAGLVHSIRGYWPEGVGNIKVTYTAGYTAVPEDLQLAIWQLCAALRRERTYGREIGSETLGRHTYRLLQSADGQASGDSGVCAARSILAGYREVAI